MKDYFFLALNNLRKRSLRTALTMLGIFIGIAAVVALVSLGQGMQNAVNQQFAGVGADKVIVQGASASFGPPGQNTAGKIETSDLELVERTIGVRRAAGRLMRMVNVENDDILRNVFAISIPEEQESRSLVTEASDMEVVEGRLLKPGEKGKVLISDSLAELALYRRPLEIGDSVKINGKQYDIVGIVEQGDVMLNEDDMRDLLGDDDEYSMVVGQVSEGSDPEVVADRIARAMRRDRGQDEGFEDFTVQTSQELIDSINTILAVVQAVFIGIAAISLLVGGIGIMNTMYTSVLERTREIGIMKAIGARNSAVMKIFLLESGLLGMAGGAVGVLLGIGLGKLVEISTRSFLGDVLQPSFPWYLIVGALAFSFGIGMLSGAFPARQASLMPPVEALRGD